jgi:PTS system nitrogen regulatory IIA component
LGKPEISAIILPAIVFFEVAGVLMVDRALRKWASWVADEEKRIRQSATALTGAADAAHRLLTHLRPAGVDLNLRGTTKNEVIEELVDLARRTSSQHIDRAHALQVLGERERLTATGLGSGVAIPHCRLMGLKQPVVVFGRHPDGVVFGGIDDLPCTLILLVLSSGRKPGEHLKLLSASAHLLAHKETREKLSAAPTPEAFIEVLANAGDRPSATGTE